MANEPTPTQQPPSVPATAAEYLNLAERFSSFADYAASTASLPQTAATSLDVARFHAFTGELTFSVDPTVRLYLDGGSVYHAEREGDQSVSRVLLDAGVIDSIQLQRGIVHVGDVEHLGRLFDRDTTIDRDAVMVVVESATESVLQQIANSVIAAVSVRAYRHHPSGIHRWFVAPVQSTGVQRPASGVMQVDRSVVEELPRLGGPSTAEAGRADSSAAPLSIEWADPDPSSPGPTGPVGNDPTNTPINTDIDIQAELDRFDADRADWAATSGGNEQDPSEAAPPPLGEFRIIWPDGTQDASIIAAGAPSPADPVVEDSIEPPIEAALPMPTALPAPINVAPLGVPVSGPVGFTIEPLQVDQIPEPDSAVPDDVAAAVRRALQAIESASSAPTSTSVPEMPLTAVALPELSMPRLGPAPEPAPLVETIAAAAPQAPPEPSADAPPAGAPFGFAPPTMDMRAEAVYERAAARAPADPSLLSQATVDDVDPSHAEPDEASTAVVDDADATQARRGALRRLIGSLRSKD